MNRLAATYLLWGAVCVSGLLPGPALAQPADPRLDKVFKDWQNRFDRTDTVSYLVKGEWVIPRGAWEGNDPGQPLVVERPPRDIVLAQKRKLLLNLPKQRYRWEGEQQCPNSLKGTVYTEGYLHLFNGKELFSKWPPGFTPDPEDPASQLSGDVGIATGDFKPIGFEPIHWPLFIGHGIVCALGRSPVPGKLAPQRDKDLFYVHGEGTFDGKRCLILRTFPQYVNEPNFDEFHVDLAKESAVVRQTRYSRNRPSCDTTIQYQQTSFGWLPKKWTINFFYPSGRTYKTERMTVEELIVSPPVSDGDFEVEIKPGMTVRRLDLGPPTKPGGAPQVDKAVYRINSLGIWNEIESSNGAKKSWWPISPWWLTILALPLAGFIWWRYSRRRARPKPVPTGPGTGT